MVIAAALSNLTNYIEFNFCKIVCALARTNAIISELLCSSSS